MFNSAWSKVLGGFLLGTVGVPMLKTDTAKKVYKYAAAGAFIARDKVLETAEVVQAAASDVSDDAKVIVEEYYKKKDSKYEAEINGTETAAASFTEVEPEA